MTKLDFKKEWRHLYAPSAQEVVEVDVPPMHFLMIDGQGDPNTSPAYTEALEALFTLSYTIKFAVKKSAGGVDYGVMPLEGLWWADDLSVFTTADRTQWQWTMMIMQPDFVSASLVHDVTQDVARKKNPAALPLVRFESFHEGRAAQILHRGPFSEEGPTIARVHAFIEAAGCQLTGKHHEIYLSDIRKAAPAQWKTIVRQPMR
ncbi:GyrI-like domain-containing protein [Gemmatimonas aurantiaca]|uniref:GyrI-like domain-containing protein n=1 Tax=Gemmatimonas aurantiaca TaxID=173480 RepID=UPI00301D4D30